MEIYMVVRGKRGCSNSCLNAESERKAVSDDIKHFA